MSKLDDVLATFSASKLDLAERCLEAFRARYIDGQRSPPSAALALGRAVDATTNAVYFGKLSTHETEDAETVTARFADWWDVESRPVEIDAAERGEILDAGVASIRHWRDRVAMRVQPLTEPQVPVSFAASSARPDLDAAVGITSTWRVIGYFDVLGEVPRPDGSVATAIIDHKASRKTYNATDVARSVQPPIYRAGTGVALFQFHVLRTDLKNPRTMVASHLVADDAIGHVVHRMELARRTIARCHQSGDWAPSRNQTLCSRRWCGFWQGCERRHGGKVSP